MPKFVLLWTDAVLWVMAVALVAYIVYVWRSPARSANWRKVFRDPAALASSIVLALCLALTMADSLHYRPLLPPAPGVADAAPAYDVRTRSLLDLALERLVDSREQTYSRPLAYVGFTKESVEVDGKMERIAPRLKFGGAQLRPNLHIEDMVDLYLLCLQLPDEKIDGRIFNAGYENIKVSDLAERVRGVVGDVAVEVLPTDDPRSYHVSSALIQRELGFQPKHTVEEAIRDLVKAFKDGRLPNAMTDKRYYNIKTMQSIKLT